MLAQFEGIKPTTIISQALSGIFQLKGQSLSTKLVQKGLDAAFEIKNLFGVDVKVDRASLQDLDYIKSKIEMMRKLVEYRKLALDFGHVTQPTNESPQDLLHILRDINQLLMAINTLQRNNASASIKGRDPSPGSTATGGSSRSDSEASIE